jgi:sugar phosphate isomerase/epimerase
MNNFKEIIYPKSFIEFTRYCEVNCVAGCCGLDAFAFDGDTIKKAIEKYGLEKSQKALNETQTFAEEIKGIKVECYSDADDFNAVFENGEDLASWVNEITQLLKNEIR